MIAAAFPARMVMQHLLGPEAYAEYTLWGNAKAANIQGKGTPTHGLDTGKLFQRLAAVILLVNLIVIPLALDCYTIITPTGIVKNAFFSFGEKRYVWADVQDIRNVLSLQAPNGRHVRNPYFEVRFRDGQNWSTHDSFANPTGDEAPMVFQYIAKQSGKPIITEDPYPDAVRFDSAPSLPMSE